MLSRSTPIPPFVKSARAIWHFDRRRKANSRQCCNLRQKMELRSFFVNLDNDHWSSLDVGWASRNETRYRQVSVSCLTLSSLIDEFGPPYYLKVDVEGVDQSVLEQLKDRSLLPLYVSVEDCRLVFNTWKRSRHAAMTASSCLTSRQYSADRSENGTCFSRRIVRSIR